jgi:hypothetical protein
MRQYTIIGSRLLLPMRIYRSLASGRVASAVAASAVATIVVGCHHSEPPAPAVATPSLTLSQARAPLGSPIDLTYKFVVANDAHFDQDYRVMAHVVDSDEQLMWTDDHNPPVPTTGWKAGQTVEYTRTVFVPVYPYVGEATIQVGLYSTTGQKRLPLSGEDMGQRAYRVARLQLLPQSENVHTIFKDGWHATEIAERNASVEWQWTKKEATLAFKNPKKDSVFYLDADNPGGAFEEQQQVQVSLGNHVVDQFTIVPKQPVLRKIPLGASQLGTADMVELEIAVDKTFVPALIPAANSRDPRELGIRVFHAFIQPRT